MNKILVIGDSCEDVFVYGNAERLCPDAPVPVFIAKLTKKNGGMALNVYNNLLALKCEADIITNKETIVKTRYIDKKINHMFLRVDSGEEKIKRCEVLSQIDFSSYKAIVISDYNKGFLLEEDIEYICSKHPIVFLDTKKLLKSWYKKVPFIKINEQEYHKTEHLIDNKDNLIVTVGNKGAKFKDKIYPVPKVEIKDTVGAGDTFLAGLVSEYVKNNNIEKAISFANECATMAVQQKGVYVIGTN